MAVNFIYNRVFNYLFKKRKEHIITLLITKDFLPNGFNYFRNFQDAKNWGEDHFQDKIKKIQDEHGKHVLDFRSSPYFKSSHKAIEFYCGFRYKEVNLKQRFGVESEITWMIDEMIAHLDEELNSSILTENIVVVRWVNRASFIDFYGHLIEGKILSDPGFMSTSLFLDFSMDTESKERRVANDLLLIVKIPKGRKCLYVGEISNRPQEQEILLAQNSVLMVNKIYKVLMKEAIALCTVIR